jgi:hypothetical protein
VTLYSPLCHIKSTTYTNTRSTLNDKIRKARIRLVVYVLMFMMLWEKNKSKYYDQIQEIWELDFHGFKIPLFHCNWDDAVNGFVKDKNYGFISIDLNHQGYKSEPFMLAKHVAQVFYVPDTINKRLKGSYTWKMMNRQSWECRRWGRVS